MHFAAFLVFLTVTALESSPFNCTNCGNVKCGENEVFVTGKARQDEFCKPFYTPTAVLNQPRRCVCKTHFVRNSWGECVPKKKCLRCKSRLQKDWHLCSSSCPVTGNKAIRFFCRTMCTPGCDCPPDWVVDPNNWKKCIKAEASPPICQPHSRFQPCVSTCEPVCGLRPPKHCFTHCHRGACVCNKGFAALVRNRELICVRQEKCEWYLRTAHFSALNMTATAGGENVANNLGGLISGPGGVVLPGAIGHAVTSERSYSVGTAPNGNAAIGLHGGTIHSATRSSGNAIGLGSTGTGIGTAGILPSGAAGPSGTEAGLGITLSPVSARPGMTGVRVSGSPSFASPGPGTGSEGASNALPSVSTGSTFNHGGFISTDLGTRVNIREGPIGTSTGAAATTGQLPPAAPGLGTIGSPVTSMSLPDSGTTRSGVVGPHPNVRADGVIAVSSGAAGPATVAPSFPVAGLGAVTAGIARAPVAVSTRSHFSNTNVATAQPAPDAGSVVHGSTSATGGAAGFLPNSGVRHDAITVTTGAAMPVSHGGVGVGTGSATTVRPLVLRGSSTVLSGATALQTSPAEGIHAGGERAGGRPGALVGPGMVNVGPLATGVSRLLTSSTTENDRIVAGIGTTPGSVSSDSYRLASLSALPDGIYRSTHGTAMIPSIPKRPTGVPFGSGTAVLPPHVHVTTSEVRTGLNARGPFYAGHVGETIRITAGNGSVPDAGGLHSHALETISTGVNGANVLTATPGSTFSAYGTGSRGHIGVVSAPETPTSVHSSGSGNVATTESGGSRAGGASNLSSEPRGHGSVESATTHPTDASSGVITEVGGSDGFNGADGRHTSASIGHGWTYTSALDGLNANGVLVTSIARNTSPVSTSTSTVGNGTAHFVAPPGATNSHGTMSFGETHGTVNAHATYRSETTGSFGNGAAIGAENNALSSSFAHSGSLAGTSRGGAVMPSTVATRGPNHGVHLSHVIPVGTVGTVPSAIGARTEGAGAAGPIGNVAGYRIDITNPYSVGTHGKTLSNVYPFVLSAVTRSGAAESTSRLLRSGSALASSLPHVSVFSSSIDIGENLPSTARVIGGVNNPVSVTTPFANK
uniref:TIL domain containing protein n=1 Tax=Rhipicephalus appendiculatus TaxID=34631 RepID=A0A131YLT8_RHIAP